MEKKITLSMILGIIFTLNVHAISFHDVNGLQGPVHPLNFYSIRCLGVDTAYCYVYYESGNEYFGEKLTSIFTRSEDGLTDTVCVPYDIRSMTYHYSEDNRLIYYTDYSPEFARLSPWNKATYEYDDEGRMFRVTVTGTSRAGQLEEEVRQVGTYDYSTIQLTDSGYIWGEYNSEFILDSIGRVLHIKNLNKEDNFVECPENGKMYRYNEAYYSYTDSSCTKMGYYHLDDMILGMSDRWGKSVYVFNEKGYLKSRHTSVSLDAINWFTLHHYEYEYVYSGDETNNRHIEEANNTKVYGLAGEINITTDNYAIASVYNFHGQLIKQQQVSQGDNRINLPKGFYIVTVGDKSFKAFVR